MQRISIALAFFCGLTLCSSALGQPILDRLEQRLRQGVPQLPPIGTQGANEPGYLGVIADDRQEQGRGVRVLDVLAAGPASQGGLKKGDLIIGANDQKVGVMDDMGRVLEKQPAGAKVSFTVNREGVERKIDVTLGRRPQDVPPGGPHELPMPSAVVPGPRLGVRTVPVSREVQQQNNLANTEGALVTSVTRGSPADRAGVPVDAIIQTLNGKPTRSPEELAVVVRSAGEGEIEMGYHYRGEDVRTRLALSSSATPDQPKLELRARPPEPPAPSDVRAASRFEELEARLRELEARVEKLEAKQTKGE